jgi:exopolyphosphatase / guanosine-5'-triphosphate,3'-diphosphate pyrophosphatase
VRVAVVDLGTNSTRLLVADVEDGDVAQLERRSVVTRLGEGVDAAGQLAPAAIGRVFETLAGFRDVIDRCGAERGVGVATSAVRDADDGERFLAELRARFGVDARLISGAEEARLTFLGATARRTDRDAAVVIDIGGGSTEFVVGRAGANPDFHVSTALGSVRHTERHLHGDPPRPEELEALSRDARRIIEQEVPHALRHVVDAGVAVAGTATQLASIDLESGGRGGDQVDGHRLTRDACRGVLERLAALPLDERRQVQGLDPDRAPTIVAGAAVLVEGIEAFRLDSVEVSEADLLHGAALDAWAQGR